MPSIRPASERMASRPDRFRADRAPGGGGLRATALALAVLGRLLAAAEGPEAVVVGKGSYASAPPAGDAKLLAALVRHLPIEPAQEAEPVPSNKWWSDLLISPYPGKLWAYPATVGSDARGVRIWYPQGWSEAGNELALGEPLEIQAVDHAPSTASSDVVIADFEGDSWPAGWTASGTAWGSGPARGALPGQTPVSGFIGHGLASSYHGGDGATGELLSAPFALSRDYLHFLIHGGRDAAKLHIDLEIDGVVVRSATGDNSEQLGWHSWEVRQWQGKSARLRLVDHASGGWGHLGVDQLVLSGNAEPGASAGLFKPGSTTALRWGDWTLSMRLHAGAERWLDCSCGRGLPYVWIECKDLDVRIPLSGDHLSTLAGTALSLPQAADALIIERGTRLFGLFAPEHTRFALAADGALEPTFPGKERYLVVALLDDRRHAELLQKYAYAVPRTSSFSWRYDHEAGEVVTSWTVAADALRGDRHEVLQGWLPHQWRTTRNNLSLSEAAYGTQRGRLRLAPGKAFEISWPFNGLLPTLPAPSDAGLEHPFVPARLFGALQQWSAERAAKPSAGRFGADTYWGGKDIGLAAQYLAIARAAGAPAAGQLHDLVAEGLGDWFTYTPGERAHFFARYPAPWKGLVGFAPSYGSEEFTDNHFHYGYFTLAAALLGRDDAQFIAGFGGMARLVAKQYANWERADRDFPLLRTFDPWAGHSYAGGHSSHEDGNNQESSSEAMQSWGGLLLLGATLNDEAMVAAGAMGYAIEGEAIREYWNDYYAWKQGAEAANFPPAYKHRIIGVLRDRDQGFWTWFSGNPLHIYGIQWLPLSTALQYLGRDPAFTGFQIKNMLSELAKGRAGFGYSDLDGDWGNVVLGAATFADSEDAVAVLDALWDVHHPIVRDQHFALTYYLAHAYRSLGQVAWDCHTSLPTSTVFHDSRSGRFRAVAWNPSAKELQATVWRAGKQVGRMTVPAGALVTVQDVIPAER
jgi:endoglucanase Acf2